MSKSRWITHTKLIQEHVEAGGTIKDIELELSRNRTMRPGEIAEISKSRDPLEFSQKKYIQRTPDGKRHHLEVLPGGHWRVLTEVYKGSKRQWRPVCLTGGKKRRKIAGPKEEVWPPMDTWTIGTKSSKPSSPAAWPGAARNNKRKRRGNIESITTAKTIATTLASQGWTGEATTLDKAGKPKRQSCPPWKLPSAPKKYQSAGIGSAKTWKAVHRGIRGSTLLHDAQTEAKYKLYSGATWTRTSGDNRDKTGAEVDCRLCAAARETKEHLRDCTVIRPVWNAFYMIVDEAQGNKKSTEVTPDRIFFGLDHKNNPLRGILMDLHTLFWKMIVWKFTAQDADALHPKFSPRKVITLALEALAKALMAHQQRMNRAKSRRLSDKQKDPEARLSRVAPLAAGHRKFRLVLQRSFAMTLAAAGIDAFKENKTTTKPPAKEKGKSKRKGGPAPDLWKQTSRKASKSTPEANKRETEKIPGKQRNQRSAWKTPRPGTRHTTA